MNYFIITNAGTDFFAKAITTGVNPTFTRVMFGSGTPQPGDDPRTYADLINPFAAGTSTIPVTQDKVISLVAEYRNDLNGGLETDTYIGEFGIFADDPELGEIMIYYAFMGAPIPISAYTGFIETRRFPVIIALDDNVYVDMSYIPLAFMTANEVSAAIQEAIDTIPGGLRPPLEIALESQLPDPTTLTSADVGTQWVVQDMDVTAPGKTGRAWVNYVDGDPANPLTIYKTVDNYYSADGVSIILTPTGQLSVSTSWLTSTLASIYAPLNAALSADTGTGTDITTPAVPTNTVQNIFQTVWGKIRQLGNVISGKQDKISAGTAGRVRTSSGTLGTLNELSSTVGSATLPIYMNAGVPTALTQANMRIGTIGAAAVGSANQPIYFAANGVPTAVTGATPVERGGTNRTSQATGNMNYATSATDTGVVAAPTANVDQVMVHSGAQNAVPVWRNFKGSNSIRSYLGIGTGTKDWLLCNNTLANNTDTTTAFGRDALNSMVYAQGSTAIGYEALKNHSMGNVSYTSHNTAVGSGALRAVTTGIYNVAVGSGAASSITTGERNIAIGCEALQFGGANDNIGIGYQSRGRNINQCVYIGNNAGGANDGINQIVIGYSATATANNQITLGNSSITQLRCQVTTITALSDERTKEYYELADLQKCLEAVKNLPVSRYKYKDFTGTHLDSNVTGFMADDVEKVFPKSVTRNSQYFPVLDENGDKVYEEIDEEYEETMKVINEKGDFVMEEYEEDVPVVDEEKGLMLYESYEYEVEGVDRKGNPRKIKKKGERPVTRKEKRTRPLEKRVKLTRKRKVEKMFKMEDVKEITMTEAVPTLWGAVQYLIREIEELKSKEAS